MSRIAPNAPRLCDRIGLPVRLRACAVVQTPSTPDRGVEAAAPSGLLDQVRVAAAVLTAHGYVAIGLDHFALPDDHLPQAQ